MWIVSRSGKPARPRYGTQARFAVNPTDPPGHPDFVDC
ncbi:hypothetical protein [Arthrobacter sp. DR-2P]|nr:hypothetical protein [Arthrobacter sp. DR-2P]